MQQTKTTLVLGATPNPDRYAHKATVMLTEYGHPVVPFGIKRGSIGDLEILNKWPGSADVHTVTLYINAKIQESFYAQIIALKPKRIIFNPGTENPKLADMATEQGIEALDACTLVMLKTNHF